MFNLLCFDHVSPDRNADAKDSQDVPVQPSSSDGSSPIVAPPRRRPVHYVGLQSDQELNEWLEETKASAKEGARRLFEFELPPALSDMRLMAVAGAISRQLVDRYGFAIECAVRTDQDTGSIHLMVSADVMGSDRFGSATLLGEFEWPPSAFEEIQWLETIASRTIDLHMQAANAAGAAGAASVADDVSDVTASEAATVPREGVAIKKILH